MNEAFNNSFWIILRYVITSLLGFGMSIMFAKSGNLNLYGQYMYVLSIVGLFSTLALPGINLSAIKSVANNSPGGVYQAVKLSFKAGLVGAILLFIWALLISSDKVILQSFLLAAIIFPAYYSTNVWYAFYEGKLLIKNESLRIILAGLFTTAFMALAIVSRKSLMVLVGIFYGIGAFFSAIYLLEGLTRYGWQIKTHLDINFGIKVTLQKFSLSLMDNIPVILVTHLFSYTSTAIYQVSMLWLNTILALIAALSSTYMAKLFTVNKSVNNNRDLIAQILISLFLWLGFLAILKILFVAIYGDTFKLGLNIAIWLSPIILILPVKTYLISKFTANDDVVVPTVIQLVVILTAIPLIILVKPYGLLFTVVTYHFLVNFLILILFLVKDGFFKNIFYFTTRN